MQERWRLLTTWDADPGWNMALDEALLLHGPEQPTLRFYTWSPDTLSLGYFQRLVDVPPAARFVHGVADPESPGSVVRRLTGGGAIHHKNELTFSITAPLSHPLYRGKIEDSYRRVHRAIAAALAAIGVEASERGTTRLASEQAHTGMCFHKSAAVDLIWDTKKGVGSAQRRKAGRVLHHGSIKLGSTPLEGDIAIPDQQIAPELFASHLQAAMEASFAMQAEPLDQVAPKIAEHIPARAPHFTSPAFLARR